MTFTYPNETQYIWPIPPASSSGVTDVDGISGSVTLVAGAGITITDNAPAPGSITIAATGGSGQTIERRTLSAPEATAEQITLTGTPAVAAEVVLTIAGAPGQASGLDFSVTGNILSWSGLGLDGLLAAGDELTIEYNT